MLFGAFSTVLLPLTFGAILGPLPADSDDPSECEHGSGIEWAAVNLTSKKEP